MKYLASTSKPGMATSALSVLPHYSSTAMCDDRLVHDKFLGASTLGAATLPLYREAVGPQCVICPKVWNVAY